MRAVILAGGKGTRLLPHTEYVPKPLVRVAENQTILDILIKQLAAQGFNHITLAVNHLADIIIEYIGDGSRWGIKIDYSRETEPLHTIGPITLIPDLPSDFLVVNGDVLTDVDYGSFLQEHSRQKYPISIAVKNREIGVEFGVVEFDENQMLTAFKEKPVHKVLVTMGVNCLSSDVINQIPRSTRYGFDDLMRDSISNGRQVHVHEHSGFWLDIGRPSDYQYVIENYDNIKKILKI